MESGHWDFSPDWFTYFFHKDYSGAYTKWEWHGFKSGLRVHFKEDKSNVKTVAPRRAASQLADKLKKEVVEKERKMIEELTKEEEARAADRNVDLMYSKYKDSFNNMQANIKDNLLYCMTISKGEMAELIDFVLEYNEICTANIAYLHKTGVGYELENAKRDKGYREAQKEMEDIVKASEMLVRVANVYYREPKAG